LPAFPEFQISTPVFFSASQVHAPAPPKKITP
jgi:hypothetical protein